MESFREAVLEQRGDQPHQEHPGRRIRAFRRSVLQAVAVCFGLLTVVAAALAVSSRSLDERMVFILHGLGRIWAATVLAFLSFQVAVWTKTYELPWWKHSTIKLEDEISVRELRFRIQFSIYREFLASFIFLWPFFQGNIHAFTIPASIALGMFLGCLLYGAVHLTLKRRIPWFRYACMGLLILLVVGGSTVLFSDGIWFIALVWEQYQHVIFITWAGKAFVVWLFALLFLHGSLLYWQIRQRQQRHAAASTQRSGTARHHESSSQTKRSCLPENQGSFSAASISSHDMAMDLEASCEQSDTVENREEDDEAKEAAASKATVGDNTPPDDEPLKREQREENERIDPSCDELFRRQVKCCSFVRDANQTRTKKAISLLIWTIWFVLVGFSLWLVIINTGATVEQNRVRDKLPYVHEAIYETMNQGAVCAFDNRGADSNITTFADKDTAHNEGFFVLHCGACGACSDWHNLRLEYTTREFLAGESARCARKSLTGGREAVLQCLEKQPIGFRGQCAKCWTASVFLANFINLCRTEKINH